MKDLDPQVVLESPFECSQIKYNPHRPNLIVGGLNTGQVVIWDTAEREERLEQERLNNHVGEDNGSKEAKELPPLKPLDLSSIDGSHNRPVQQLMWLPRGVEFTAKGEVNYIADKEINQFVTIATDGKFNIWDIRFRKAKPKRHKSQKPGHEIQEFTVRNAVVKNL